MKRVLLSTAGAAFLVSSGFGAVLLTEQFNYSDGALTTVSGGLWANHSGTTLQQNVASGCLELRQSEAEDTNRGFAIQGSGALWAGADVNFSILPLVGAGTYFMHFKDATTSGFRGRVFATITGAATGKFRIGIAEGSGTATFISTDLSLGTTYRVIFSTDVATNDSTVELLGVGGPINSLADATAPLVLSTIAMRQSNASGGMGGLCVDNLIVGTSRAEVVPEPATFLGLGIAATALIARRRRRK